MGWLRSHLHRFLPSLIVSNHRYWPVSDEKGMDIFQHPSILKGSKHYIHSMYLNLNIKSDHIWIQILKTGFLVCIWDTKWPLPTLPESPQLCRVPGPLPCAFHRALGKDLLCRAPQVRRTTTAGDSSSKIRIGGDEREKHISSMKLQ